MCNENASGITIRTLILLNNLRKLSYDGYIYGKRGKPGTRHPESINPYLECANFLQSVPFYSEPYAS